ncbi:hypothetical protein ACUTJJ_18900 [Agrobacterium sp. DKPNP3]|nr:hypothetical protein [uncultured Agrobacterium sp.]
MSFFLLGQRLDQVHFRTPLAITHNAPLTTLDKTLAAAAKLETMVFV